MTLSYKRKIWNIISKNKLLKNIFLSIWNIFKIINRLVLMIFFDKKYMYGRWFDNSLVGWKWMWKGVFWQKILGVNRHVRWPVYHTTKISKPARIEFDKEDLQIFQSGGCYFQCYGNIKIGKGSYIAPNVGIITANHSLINLDEHDTPKDVIIGEKCWVGMNSVILPGVILKDKVVVGAGAVVNKNFEDNKIIGGVPAKIIKINESRNNKYEN